MKLQAVTLCALLVAISCCFASTTSPKPTNGFKSTTEHSVGSSGKTANTSKAGVTTAKPASTASGRPAMANKTTKKATTSKSSAKMSSNPTARPGNQKSTASHKPGKMSKPTNKTTPKPKLSCEMRNDSCSKCLEDSSCFYCANDHSCSEKTGKFLPKGCKGNNWYWKQCKINGEWVRCCEICEVFVIFKALQSIYPFSSFQRNFIGFHGWLQVNRE